MRNGDSYSRSGKKGARTRRLRSYKSLFGRANVQVRCSQEGDDSKGRYEGTNPDFDDGQSWEWGGGFDDNPVPLHPLVPESEVVTICGKGRFGYRDGHGTEAMLNAPMGLCVAPSGSIYVADSYNNCIRKIAVDGEVTTLAGNGSRTSCMGHRDGPRSQSLFAVPYNLAVDADENVYVADTFNHVIRKIDSSTHEVTTISGMAGVDGYADGPAKMARYHYPYNLVLTPDQQDFIIMDTRNYFLRKMTKEGEVTTMEGVMDEDGELMAFVAELGDGLTIVERTGQIVVADAASQTLDALNVDQTIELIAGVENAPELRDGVGSEAKFWGLHGISADKEGNIYVADGYNHVIRKVLPDKTVLTFAGDLRGLKDRTNFGHRDGASNIAAFRVPSGIDVGPDGSIYVCEKESHNVRKITILV